MVQGVLMGPERRRRWSEDQKLELLAQAFGPGGNVTANARRADILTSLLYRWRRESPAQLAVLVEAPDRRQDSLG